MYRCARSFESFLIGIAIIPNVTVKFVDFTFNFIELLINWLAHGNSDLT